MVTCNITLPKAKSSTLTAVVYAPPQDRSRGDLLVSLNYDPGLNIIQGVIVKATNLQKQDLTGLAGSSLLNAVIISFLV